MSVSGVMVKSIGVAFGPKTYPSWVSLGWCGFCQGSPHSPWCWQASHRLTWWWWYIYNGEVCVCVCVCLSQKSLFLYSKDLAVSPVSRHFPYSRYLVISPVYRHFLLYSNQKCLETGEMTKSRKCLETGETTKFFEYGMMCLETGETAKSFEYRNNDFCDRHTDRQTNRQLLLYINHNNNCHYCRNHHYHDHYHPWREYSSSSALQPMTGFSRGKSWQLLTTHNYHHQVVVSYIIIKSWQPLTDTIINH